MVFNQGASRPKGTITAKSTRAPQNASRLKLKKIQRIQRNIDGKKLVSSLFLILIFFLFSAKSGGGGAKKWWGRGPTRPSPSAVPVHGFIFFLEKTINMIKSFAFRAIMFSFFGRTSVRRVSLK